MQGQNVIRTLLFVIFFSIGAAAMTASVLCDDLVRYYRNKHYLNQAERLTSKLEALNDDYDAVLIRMEDDPNLVKRLAPAALGAEPADPNTIFPLAPPHRACHPRLASALQRAKPADIPLRRRRSPDISLIRVLRPPQNPRRTVGWAPPTISLTSH